MNKFKPNFLELVPNLNHQIKHTIVHKKSNASIEDFKTLMIIKELEGLVAKQVAVIRDKKEKQKLMMPKPEGPRYEANILVSDKVNKIEKKEVEVKENKVAVTRELEKNQVTSTKKAKRKRQGESFKTKESIPNTKGRNLQKNRIKVYKSRSGTSRQATSATHSRDLKRTRTRRIKTRPKKS